MGRRPNRLLRWAHGTTATLVEPSSSKAEAGYALAEKVPNGWLNAHLHLAGAWIGHLRGPRLGDWSRAAHAALTAFDDVADVSGLAADTSTEDTSAARRRYAIVGQVSATPALRVSRRGLGAGWVARALPSMTGEVRGIAFVGRWLVWSETAGELWSTYADDGTNNSAIGTSNSGYWTAETFTSTTVRGAAWCAGLTGRAANARHAVVFGDTLSAASLLYSTNSGTTWTALSVAWGSSVYTTDGAYDATRDRFVAVSGVAGSAVSTVGAPASSWTVQLGPGGISAALFKIRCGGGTWITWDTHAIGGTALTASLRQAFRTTDAGATWEEISTSLPRDPAASSYPVLVRDIAYADGVWVASVDGAPYLYASHDDGDTWERVALPVGEESTWALARVLYADGQVLATGVDFCVASGRAMATEDTTLVPDTTPSILSDAYRLRGRTIATTAPTNGQVYAWNSGTSQWEPAAAASTPTTTRGDLIVRGASADQRLAVGASGRYLRSDGTDPGWSTIPSTDVTGLPWSDRISPSTVQTTDATTTTLKSYTTTTDKGHAIDLIVSATQSDRSAQVVFKILASITNAAGTCTMRDVVITPTDPASTWVATVDASGADIRVRVTGAGGTTIDWCVAGTLLVHGS